MVGSGRNDLCICGSGKKYKKCCLGKSEMFIDPATTAVFVDDTNRRIIHFKETMLANQLKREIPEVARSFDALCGDYLNNLSAVFSSASATILSGYMHQNSKDDPVVETSGTILMNCLNTFASSVHLLRSGFRLQPGFLLRSIVESASVAMAIRYNRRLFEELKAGTLKSPKAVTVATKSIPMLGPLYGLLSNEFIHVGQLHTSPHSLGKYTEIDDALRSNLSMLRSSLWLLDIVGEAVFFECSERHKYWKSVDTGKLVYSATGEDLEWLEEKF